MTKIQLNIKALKYNVLLPSVSWCCWLGVRMGICPVKTTATKMLKSSLLGTWL